jgi:predicted ABC-type ATPase
MVVTAAHRNGGAHGETHRSPTVDPSERVRYVTNSDSAVRKAANVAQERRERAVRERRSLAFETVFSGVDKVKSIANCAAVAREVDRLYLYDNSFDGAPPRLSARVSNGEIVRRYGQEPSWMEPILAAMS